ncbi:hypothetical protein [Aeropyrum camini]|uniref:Uncharacterized protein n=1 Tax=Aeropyrum camini SY1 = JCM 12091 TaxID=1198449 RepID=U3TBI9_9CREN|nr:hypothetical protein [Aeropyrum camini]BAN89786.1 hypothetical protein ACAM_0317 [Aeropyrum camini SY1 = JCM 12091]
MSERVPAGGPYKAVSGSHEVLGSESLREAREALANYCSASRDYCSAYLERLLRLSRGIALKRLVDLYGDSGYKGVDKPVLEVLGSLVEFYASYISGLLPLHGEEVLVRSEATIMEGGVRLLKGEVTAASPGLAARLYVAGLASLVESNAKTLRLKPSNP